MLMRYTATNSRLQRRSGILGLKSAGGSAIEIVQCTDRMLHDFCTIGLNRPISSRERRLGQECQEGQVDAGLLSHLKSHIDFFNADAERAEQLAGSHCRRPLLAAARPVLPALRVVNWDAAHGSRRMTKRPWTADAILLEIVTTVVANRNSIVGLIQNSVEFVKWFQDAKNSMSNVIGKKVKNLSLAKHRCDSTSRPISRAVLNLHGLIKTADQIARLRRTGSREVDTAKEFLRFIDVERAIQLGMLADAGIEALHLTRLCDKENLATEDVGFWVSSTLSRIQMLFVDGDVVTTVGHTKWIIDVLKSSPLVFFVDGAPRQLGGAQSVTVEIVKRCLGRMSSWVRMATTVLESEFPNFRVLSAMSIFSVTPGNERGQGAEDVTFDASSERLCRSGQLILDNLDLSRSVEGLTVLTIWTCAHMWLVPGLWGSPKIGSGSSSPTSTRLPRR